ncbi:unnamed protein product [Ostreobium quekettii]|uniref:Adenylate kinase isoenzyme 6 homolog n=1 Tax=Ostreobium quekettii TaxID=121088 RepID=A0A8S1JHL7_9CHLO|nr:unnamed protein product [Ostreobium quekettii]|eukprot:evm.model.scf_442.6 EVM.evm.TU.scf_442.6   scf_442:66250-69242(+)
MTRRSAPNILVTGTPGVGKSTICDLVAKATGLCHINVGDIVKDQGLHDGWDDQYQSWIVDEDKVCDYLEDIMSEGATIVEYHSCDFFPERWMDLVVVLRTNNTTLYERLEKRGYSEAKIQENVTCEIMNVVLDEAMESYRKEIVMVLQNDDVEEMERNVESIVQRARQYVPSAS